jgi:hypothetical protein
VCLSVFVSIQGPCLCSVLFVLASPLPDGVGVVVSMLCLRWCWCVSAWGALPVLVSCCHCLCRESVGAVLLLFGCCGGLVRLFRVLPGCPCASFWVVFVCALCLCSVLVLCCGVSVSWLGDVHLEVPYPEVVHAQECILFCFVVGLGGCVHAPLYDFGLVWGGFWYAYFPLACVCCTRDCVLTGKVVCSTYKY